MREWFPLFASPLIRNRATLGGNLATASPIGDAAPLLLALDAGSICRSGGARQIPLREFFLGYRRTALRPGEVWCRYRSQAAIREHTRVLKSRPSARWTTSARWPRLSPSTLDARDAWRTAARRTAASRPRRPCAGGRGSAAADARGATPAVRDAQQAIARTLRPSATIAAAPHTGSQWRNRCWRSSSTEYRQREAA